MQVLHVLESVHTSQSVGHANEIIFLFLNGKSFYLHTFSLKLSHKLSLDSFGHKKVQRDNKEMYKQYTRFQSCMHHNDLDMLRKIIGSMSPQRSLYLHIPQQSCHKLSPGRSHHMKMIGTED